MEEEVEEEDTWRKRWKRKQKGKMGERLRWKSGEVDGGIRNGMTEWGWNKWMKMDEADKGNGRGTKEERGR